jgi:hypothetical protein
MSASRTSVKYSSLVVPELIHLARNVLFQRLTNTIMKTIQKQTVRHGNLHRFPKFSIPPELLILRELRLMEMADRSGPLSRLHQVIPQHQRG